MNRNLKPQSRNETRYTLQNPPESDEAAQARIKKLQADVASIREDLETQTVLTFHDESEFEIWKRRATTAVKHKARELRFLERWLGERIMQVVQTSITTLVENYQQTYSPVFGVHHPVKDPEEAKVRVTVVAALQSHIDMHLAQFREVASEHGIKAREQQGIARPLQSIATTIKGELQYLRNVLHILAPETAGHYEGDREQSEQEIAIAGRAKELADEIASERPPPYDNAENPPPTFEEAQARLNLVSSLVKTLEKRFEELSTEWRTATNTGLSKWAKRPISQLRLSMDTELGCLNKCIRQMMRQDQEHAQEAAQATQEQIFELDHERRETRHAELAEISQRIRQQAIDLAREIGEVYTRTYTSEHPPQSIEEANNRLKKIVETKRQLQVAFSDITDTWCSHPLRRGDLTSVKKPLMKILYEVEAEIVLINAFLKERQSATMPGHLHWKSVCASALTRASFEGFKLTAEERVVVTALLAEISRAAADSR